eukprot:scpid92567/ scgid19699/ 
MDCDYIGRGPRKEIDLIDLTVGSWCCRFVVAVDRCIVVPVNIVCNVTMSDSEISDASSDGPSTPRKKRIACHTSSKGQSEWTKYGMKPSKKGLQFAFCTLCSCDFSVAGGGVHEVKRHCDSRKHKVNF